MKPLKNPKEVREAVRKAAWCGIDLAAKSADHASDWLHRCSSKLRERGERYAPPTQVDEPEETTSR